MHEEYVNDNYYARFLTHSYQYCTEMHINSKLVHVLNFDKFSGAGNVGQWQQVMVHARRVFEGHLLCKG